MKKEPGIAEADDRVKDYRAELRKARWCDIAGKGAAIAPLIAAGVLFHTFKLEQSEVIVRVDTDLLAMMVGGLGFAIGKARAEERTKQAEENYYASFRTENT